MPVNRLGFLGPHYAHTGLPPIYCHSIVSAVAIDVFCNILLYHRVYGRVRQSAILWFRVVPFFFRNILPCVLNRFGSQLSSPWKPGVKYVFHGELSWDPNLLSTQGRIFLKKKGTTLNQRIADWSNPPINAVIEQDITKYVDGNGTYIIEWQYMGGRSGVCIMRSEITPAD